jgi:hypothetical protein
MEKSFIKNSTSFNMNEIKFTFKLFNMAYLIYTKLFGYRIKIKFTRAKPNMIVGEGDFISTVLNEFFEK